MSEVFYVCMNYDSETQPVVDSSKSMTKEEKTWPYSVKSINKGKSDQNECADTKETISKERAQSAKMIKEACSMRLKTKENSDKRRCVGEILKAV